MYCSRLVIAAIVATCTSVYASDVIVREIASCGQSAVGDRSPDEVRDFRREGKALVVSVFAKGNCGGTSAGRPEARISANTVALSWMWVHREGAPVTGCTCWRHLEFRVKDAPEGQLTVTAEAREK